MILGSQHSGVCLEFWHEYRQSCLLHIRRNSLLTSLFGGMAAHLDGVGTLAQQTAATIQAIPPSRARSAAGVKPADHPIIGCEVRQIEVPGGQEVAAKAFTMPAPKKVVLDGPPVHWRTSSAGQTAGHAVGVAVRRICAATAPGLQLGWS